MDLLDFAPISDEVATLEGTQHIEDIKAIHAQFPEFFERLMIIGGLVTPDKTASAEFNQGNQFALLNIAAQVRFAVKFNGINPEKIEENNNA